MSIGAYEQKALYVWPDNSWCEPEEYDERNQGDDFMVIKVPSDMDDDDVDRYLEELKPQG